MGKYKNHARLERRKQRERLKHMNTIQAQTPPQGMSLQEAEASLAGNLEQIEAAIDNQKANYANTLLLVARDIFVGLAKDQSIPPEEALEASFGLMHSFRKRVALEESMLKEQAPIAKATLQQRSRLLEAKDKLEAMIKESQEETPVGTTHETEATPDLEEILSSQEMPSRTEPEAV